MPAPGERLSYRKEELLSLEVKGRFLNRPYVSWTAGALIFIQSYSPIEKSDKPIETLDVRFMVCSDFSHSVGLHRSLARTGQAPHFPDELNRQLVSR